MWIFMPFGFYSVVAHRDDPSLLIVRARVAEDLENLREYIPSIEPFEDVRADYRFRAIVRRDDWIVTLARWGGELDWHNFKDAVTERQGKERHDVYLSVWSVLYNRLQAPFRRRQAAGQLAFVGEVVDDHDVAWGELPWERAVARPEYEGGPVPATKSARRRRRKGGKR